MSEYGAVAVTPCVRIRKVAGAREELTQEIALAIWQALPHFRGDCSERTFVYRIAHNRGMTHVCRRLPAHQALDDLSPLLEPADPRPHPEEQVAMTHQRNRLRSAIQRLPLAYRQVVMLMLEELSHAEIGEVLGITESNVAVRLNRARKALKEALEDARDQRYRARSMATGVARSNRASTRLQEKSGGRTCKWLRGSGNLRVLGDFDRDGTANSKSLMAGLASGIAFASVVLGGYAWRVRREAWTPTAQTTLAYAELSYRRAVAKARTLRFSFHFLLVATVLLLATLWDGTGRGSMREMAWSWPRWVTESFVLKYLGRRKQRVVERTSRLLDDMRQ